MEDEREVEREEDVDAESLSKKYVTSFLPALVVTGEWTFRCNIFQKIFSINNSNLHVFFKPYFQIVDKDVIKCITSKIEDNVLWVSASIYAGEIKFCVHQSIPILQQCINQWPLSNQHYPSLLTTVKFVVNFLKAAVSVKNVNFDTLKVLGVLSKNLPLRTAVSMQTENVHVVIVANLFMILRN
jgi:hypothetical protein